MGIQTPQTDAGKFPPHNVRWLAQCSVNNNCCQDSITVLPRQGWKTVATKWPTGQNDLTSSLRAIVSSTCLMHWEDPEGSGREGGRWEGGSGWGIHVNPWLIHANVWQKPLQYCKVISLQLIKINEKKRKKNSNSVNWTWVSSSTQSLNNPR